MTTTIETNASGQALGWNQPPAITWSFATSNIPDDGIRKAPPYTAFADNPSARATYTPYVNVALAVWSAVADLEFEQVPDGPGVDIRIGFGDLLPNKIGSVWYESVGDTFVPGTVLQIENPQHTPLQNTDAGPRYTGYQTLVLQDLIAQLGHALGVGNSIDDPHSIGYPVLGMDNLLPDNNDIAAIQSIYGPPFIPTQSTPPPPIATLFDVPPGVTTAPKPPSAPPPPLTTRNPLLDIKSGALALPESALAVQSGSDVADIAKGLANGDTMAFLALDPAPSDSPPGTSESSMTQADLAPPLTGSAVVLDTYVPVAKIDPSISNPQVLVAGFECQSS